MAVSTAMMFWFLALFCLCPANSAVVPEKQINLLDVKAPTVKEDVSWPGFPHLKQVSAVSVDGDGNLHIFHRGDRIWDKNTFDENNRLVDTSLGPIPNDTILVIDITNGKTLYSWGSNRFYMPHGLTVDRHGNSWITDVGLHQVYSLRCKQLFAVNGPDLYKNSQSVSADHGLVMDIESGLPMTLWGPEKGFHMPHDLSVSPDGKFVYVSEIDITAPKRVYKFSIRD
ncbi:hypothetical protein JTE90_016133 [Oedothorax gibbosus]|uniref:Peptidylamidoglycolate lyase n=1 Tax=Oedothorax gibbosus TaxID=931172 RepID=A0AAV6U6S1_9ARAC|nr:hypothetical protein JTE90_016133 [Oedothorax gibbosus]